tara:strand:- start:1206 stop:1475 length:270 start_codon:yes stop_codon:yes gene_type:complete
LVLPLLAIGAGTVALAGVALGGIAIATPEDDDRDLLDEIEIGLVRLGYISEGVIKGTLVAAPPAILIVLLVSLSLSGLNWISKRGEVFA